MEQVQKLKNSKEVIAYLAEKFPLCFTLQGEAKPLKIGIFKDLAERLEGDETVSKTLIRSALRQYTSSWRYLHGVKPGAVRVDLDGQACGELEAEHIEHAKQTLAESKAKVFGERKNKQGEGKASDSKDPSERPVRKPARAAAKKPLPKRKSGPRKAAVEKPVTGKPATLEQLTTGQKVHVLIGKMPAAATIVEISKDDVQVQLDSGMTVKVKAAHLLV